MKKFDVRFGRCPVTSVWLGDFEARTPREAAEKAWAERQQRFLERFGGDGPTAPIPWREISVRVVS